MRFRHIVLALTLLPILAGCPSGGGSTINGKIVDRKPSCSKISYECWVVIEESNGTQTRKNLPWKEWNNCAIGGQFPGCANAVKGTRPRPR